MHVPTRNFQNVCLKARLGLYAEGGATMGLEQRKGFPLSGRRKIALGHGKKRRKQKDRNVSGTAGMIYISDGRADIKDEHTGLNNCPRGRWKSRNEIDREWDVLTDGQ